MKPQIQEDLLDKCAQHQLSQADQTLLKEVLTQDPSFQQELDLQDDIIKGMSLYMNQLQEKQLKKTIQSIDTELEQEGFFAIDMKEMQEDSPLEKELVQNIQKLGEEELQATINAVDKELEGEGFFQKTPITNTTKEQQPTSSSTPIFSIVSRIAVAASVVLVLTFGWQYLTGATDPTTMAFSDGSEHYDNGFSKQVEGVISENGFGGNPDEDELGQLLEGMKAYDAKNYSKAIQRLSKSVAAGISEGQRYQDQAELFLALSYFGNKEIDQAISLLKKVANKENSQKETAIWYLANIHLQKQNIGLAKTQLELLKNSDKYSTKAASLLQKL